jgi:hypothetical protein
MTTMTITAFTAICNAVAAAPCNTLFAAAFLALVAYRISQGMNVYEEMIRCSSFFKPHPARRAPSLAPQHQQPHQPPSPYDGLYLWRYAPTFRFHHSPENDVFLWGAKRKGPIKECTETTQQWRKAHDGTKQKQPNRKGHNIRFAHLFEQRVYQCDKEERQDKLVQMNSIMSVEALQKSSSDEYTFLKENYGYSRLTAPTTTKKEQKAHWRTFQAAAYFQTDADRAADLAEVNSAFPNNSSTTHHVVEPTPQTMETSIVPYVHAQKWQLMCMKVHSVASKQFIFVRVVETRRRVVKDILALVEDDVLRMIRCMMAPRLGAAEDSVLFAADDSFSVLDVEVEDSVSLCVAVDESVDVLDVAVEESGSVCVAVELSVDDVVAVEESVQVEAVALRRSKRSQSAKASQKIRAQVGPKEKKKKTVPKAKATTKSKAKSTGVASTKAMVDGEEALPRRRSSRQVRKPKWFIPG